MEIIKDLLTKNPFSRPGTKLKSVKGIVLHWTAMPGVDAKGIYYYFENLKGQSLKDDIQDRFAATHFVVGLYGKIIQCLPENEVGYHVGAHKYTNWALRELSNYPNNCTIGIELCHPNWIGNLSKQTYKSAIDLCVYLCKKYKIEPEHHIFRHYDITEKICPKFYVKNVEEWDNFILDCQDSMGG